MADYSGLITKYKTNRPLTEDERQEKLHQKSSVKADPFYALSVIKMNSTFLELVDKYYPNKGELTIFGSIILGMALTFNVSIFLLDLKPNGPHAQANSMIGFDIAVTIICLAFSIFMLWIISKECFSYTHRPIRLNRKTRMVHIFRSNRAGGVLTVPWDKVFFHYGKGAKQTLQHWDLRGHVLSEDGKTVLDTFAFSVESVEKEDLGRHWEFLRRYMEQPIEKFVPSLDPPVEVCLPIADRKEPYVFGLKRLFLNFNGHPIAQAIFSPLFFVFSLGRFVAMRTSKIPRWPDEVEATCAIDPNDPYRRDASMNPPSATYGWK